MIVRPGNENDIEEIARIYEVSKDFMKENNNPTQWRPNYPLAIDFEDDIKDGVGYVVEDDGKVVGGFAFIIGDDPTYFEIEDGAWIDDSKYGTIHRLASLPEAKGVFDTCLEFCLGKINHIRIDTHKDNKVMLHLLESRGFVRCGIITVINNTKREAFELVKKEN